MPRGFHSPFAWVYRRENPRNQTRPAWPRELGRKVRKKGAMPGESVGGRGFVGRPLRTACFCPPESLPAPPPEGALVLMRKDHPPASQTLGDLDSLVGTPTASIPYSQSRVGYARAGSCLQHLSWSLSTSAGPQEGGSPRRLRSCSSSRCLAGLNKKWSPTLRRRSQGGILGFPRLGSPGHSSRTPVILEGPRRPGMTEP